MKAEILKTNTKTQVSKTPNPGAPTYRFG